MHVRTQQGTNILIHDRGPKCVTGCDAQVFAPQQTQQLLDMSKLCASGAPRAPGSVLSPASFYPPWAGAGQELQEAARESRVGKGRKGFEGYTVVLAGRCEKISHVARSWQQVSPRSADRNMQALEDALGPCALSIAGIVEERQTYEAFELGFEQVAPQVHLKRQSASQFGLRIVQPAGATGCTSERMSMQRQVFEGTEREPRSVVELAWRSCAKLTSTLLEPPTKEGKSNSSLVQWS